MLASVGEIDSVSLNGVPSACEAVEELDERDVGFGDRLEEPALLQEAVVLGMADVGQVGVQDQQQITLRHE